MCFVETSLDTSYEVSRWYSLQAMLAILTLNYKLFIDIYNLDVMVLLVYIKWIFIGDKGWVRLS